MSLFDDCLIRVAPDGEVQARLGVGLLDDYLEFVAARCRPNTVLAVAFDLKVFFAFVGKPPLEVTQCRRAGVHQCAAGGRRWPGGSRCG